MLILHNGRIVYEKYFGALDEAGKHAAMSMTKSMTGLLAEILVAEGALDDRAAVASIVPELGRSAFGNATVRQVMDMTTALDYSEDYSDPKADIWIYSKAASPLPKPEGYEGPNGYFEYLQTVEQEGTHGEAFGYKTLSGGRYRGMWWIFHNEHGAYAERGVHGQTLYIDPAAEMVLVRFASHPQAKNAYIDPTSRCQPLRRSPGI